MAWTTPKTYVPGELVTATLMNAYVRDLQRALGEWAPGDLKMTYATHANATTSSLAEPQAGWFIANGAAYDAGTYPVMHAALGSPNPALLPDFRGRMFMAPGGSYSRGEILDAVNPTSTGTALVGGMVLILHDWV